ncbi:hypothetical protein NQ117_00300 [Paenibacillus sp. SC116]|uniref:DUF7507 domain-containing protein n=1 Tax=Paenibacillus sp. SC116 TaxID=2968986 RepID=UPI00215AC7E6|nr:hypothetical protein [Paenibacillus sp. SC116]MCR8842113.1 hypothetical protein [Paenibacillus sp. SC116]
MPFILRFSGNDTGAITFTGNTLGLSGLNGVAGTQDFIGALVTTNTSLQVGDFPPGTTNDFNLDNSSAILRLPAGTTTILYAELIWAGTYSVLNGTTDFFPFIDKSVSVTTPLGTTVSVAPDPATAQLLSINGNNNYFRSANVTSIIQTGGAGTYTVGGIVGNTENVSTSSGNHCGWTLCVVYKNTTLPFRNLSLNVGIVDIEFASTPSVDTTITGFSTPITGPVTGRMQLCAGDGDANKSGDQVLFGPNPASLTFLSGPRNFQNNFFASQICDDSGNLDTTGTFGTRNMLLGAPGANVVAGRQGWDITNVNISGTLTNNQTSATLQLRTTGDGYSVYAVGIYFDINAPKIVVNKFIGSFVPSIITGSDLTIIAGTAVVGQTLTYTVVVSNTGTTSATSTVIVDPLPNNTVFVPGSVTINGAPSGADPTVGVPVGTLAPSTSVVVTFSVTIVSLPPDGLACNQATAFFQYQSAAGGPILNGSIPSSEICVQVSPATIAFTKSANPLSGVPGDTITYTFTVTNTSTVTLTNVQVNDPLLGLFVLLNMPPGDVVTFDVDFVIPPGTPAGTLINNTATVTSDQTLPKDASAQVLVLPSFSLAVAKVADRVSVAAGDIVTYTLTVTNTSNAPLTNVTVTDDLLGFSQVIPSLDAGASQSFTVPFTVPLGTLAGTVFTNVTAATSNETGPANDSATIIVTPVPNLVIFKTVSPQTAAPGDTVTYKLTATNAGNQTLTNVRIVDPTLGIDQRFDAVNPGDSVVVTIPFIIPLTAMQGDSLVNVATVTSDQTGPTQADAVVTIIGAPSITLTKSVSPQQATVGATVTYTFEVTNTGNTSLTNVQLTDPLLELNQNIGTLAAGQSQTVDFPFVIPSGAANPFINIATVTGTSGSQTVQASDSASLNLLFPAFTLTKRVDRARVNPGETVNFTFTIVNTGAVPLTNVAVSDPLLAYTNTIALLAPGTSVTQTIPFTVPASTTPGSVIPNVVTVTPTETGPQQATATVTVNQVPAISLTKTTDRVNALPGDTITYTVIVTNTGSVPLTSVGVSDELLGLNTVIPSLGVGLSQSFTLTLVVPPGTPIGTVITNVSTAVSDQTESVTATAKVLVNDAPPSITIVKTPIVLAAAPGETVTYTITVTNTGTVVLTNVLLTDTTLGISQALGTFNPGQSQTLTFDFIIPAGTPSGSVIVNTAVVTSDQTNPEESTATITVDPAPGLTVTKALSLTQAVPGGRVTATITVKNTGNVDLTNVVITDAILNFSSVIPSLPAGSTSTFPIPFTTPTVPAGTVITNTATASSNETGPTSATATLTVLPGAQLTLVKTVSPSVALPGETVTFTFEIRNTTDTTFTNVRFTDELIGIDKTVESLPPGFFVNVSRTFTIPADARGDSVITNIATLSSDQTTPIIAVAQVTVAEDPELTISKTVFPPVAFPGEQVFFNMIGVNTGNVPLSNIRYSDPLLGINGIVQSQDVGVAVSLIVPFTIPANATPGEPIVNTVLLDSAQTGPLSTSVTVNVAGLPLTVTKKADCNTVFVGDKVRFTITVANTSSITVTNAVLTDILQTGAKFVPGSVTVAGCALPGANPNAGIPLGNIAPGETIKVTFQVKQTVLPPNEKVQNRASVSFQLDNSTQPFTIDSNVISIKVEEHAE